MKHWAIAFDITGKVLSVEEVSVSLPAGTADHEVVRAASKGEARKLGYNLYCARKKREAKKRKYANGQCMCGRKQDRPHPSGGFWKVCLVCKERQDKVYRPQQAQRVKDGTVGKIPRDEASRVAACSERVRDRKAEMKLEVLMEVRQVWQNSRTTGQFTRWLSEQIEQLLHPSQSGTDGKQRSMNA